MNEHARFLSTSTLMYVFQRPVIGIQDNSAAVILLSSSIVTQSYAEHI